MFNVIFARDILGHKTDADHLLDRWKKIFSQDDHIASLQARVDGTSDESQLSSETINQWLSCLVKAVWEAGIRPGKDENIGEVNLCKIYQQMRLDELDDYSGTTRRKKAPTRVQSNIKQKFKRTKDALVKLEQVNWWPRYLVPALRLAYEQKMTENETEEGWEEKLSRRFLNSVTEQPKANTYFADGGVTGS